MSFAPGYMLLLNNSTESITRISRATLKMRYEDTHRTFVQMVMHAGIMSDYDVQQAVVKIFNHSSSALFHIAFINSKLEPLGMMIKSACDEFTGEKYWTMMATVVDNVTRFQTQFTQGQLELLRKIFTEIIDSPEGNVPSTVCLNLCSDLENRITKADAEEFLNNAVNHKWLNSREGQYYMGVRSILELMPYFRATYQEGFNNCPLCKQAVFHGQRCEECQIVAHLYCLANFAKIQKSLTCSNCNHEIPTDGLPEPQQHTMDLDETAPGSDLSQKRMKHSNKSKSARR